MAKAKSKSVQKKVTRKKASKKTSTGLSKAAATPSNQVEEVKVNFNNTNAEITAMYEKSPDLFSKADELSNSFKAQAKKLGEELGVNLEVHVVFKFS